MSIVGGPTPYSSINCYWSSEGKTIADICWVVRMGRSQRRPQGVGYIYVRTAIDYYITLDTSKCQGVTYLLGSRGTASIDYPGPGTPHETPCAPSQKECVVIGPVANCK